MLLVREELARRIDRHPEHLGDVPAVVRNLQGFGIVARTAARRARSIHTRQEEELDPHETLALAVLAAAFRNVEREPPGIIVSRARGLRRCKQLPDMIEQSSVRREIGPRRTADRLLVDADQPL